MTYEEAKRAQVEYFHQGRLFDMHQEHDNIGEWYLMPTNDRQAVEKSITRSAVAEVKRMPTRLRVLPGGKP